MKKRVKTTCGMEFIKISYIKSKEYMELHFLSVRDLHKTRLTLYYDIILIKT